MKKTDSSLPVLEHKMFDMGVSSHFRFRDLFASYHQPVNKKINVY